MGQGIWGGLRHLFFKQTPETEKDSLYYEMSEAFRQEGCALCRLTDRYERQFMESVFYESVNDAAVRGQLQESAGLCLRHTQTFLQIGDLLGLSILGAALIENRLAVLEQPKGTGCLFCRQNEQNERRLLQAFVRYWLLQEFRTSFMESQGLCLKHFRQIYKRLEDRSLAAQLWQIERGKLKDLQKLLQEIIRKHDYRFHREAISEQETEAVKRAWDFLHA